MKVYLNDIISKFKKFSQNLDDLTSLTNRSWVIANKDLNSKNVFIFQTNQTLLISKNGVVEKAKWEYVNFEYILIEKKSGKYLLFLNVINENILVFTKDGTNESFVFIPQTRIIELILDTLDKIESYLKKELLKQDSIEKNQQKKNENKPQVEAPKIDSRTKMTDLDEIRTRNDFLLKLKEDELLVMELNFRKMQIINSSEWEKLQEKADNELYAIIGDYGKKLAHINKW
jgi:hypothetical protein